MRYLKALIFNSTIASSMSGHPFSFIGKACAIKTCEKPVEVGFKFCSRDCAVTWRSLCNLCRERPKQGRRFCGTECSAKHAERVTQPRALREICPEFLATGACRFGKACWGRHTVRSDTLDYDLALQIQSSHVERLKTFLTSVRLLPPAKSVAFVTAHKVPVAGGKSSSQMHVMLKVSAAVEGTNAALVRRSALEQLLSDETISRTVSRGFVFAAAAASVDEVVAGARKAWVMLQRQGGTSEAAAVAAAPPTFRVFASPRLPLEERLTRSLEAGAASSSSDDIEGGESPPAKRPRVDAAAATTPAVAPAATTVALAAAAAALRHDRDGFEWALFVMQMETTFAYGWAHVRPSLRCRLASTVAVTHQSLGLPCRAAWKLLEVLRRSANFTRFAPLPVASATSSRASGAPRKPWWSAIDIGSSPGGWSYAMAGVSSCKEVLAVDPGAMAEPIPANVTHIAERVETLAPRLVAMGWRAHVMTNDMNAHPRITVDALIGLLPLLEIGSRVVLTLKNFAGGRKAMDTAVQTELRRLRGILDPKSIELLHLMANGPQERTVVGVVRCILPKTFGLPPRARERVLEMLRGVRVVDEAEVEAEAEMGGGGS